MRWSASVVCMAAFIAAALPAAAGVGQCFDRFGRPVGPSYNAGPADHGRVAWALAHDAYCTRVGGVTPVFRGETPGYYHPPGGGLGFSANPVGTVIQSGPYTFNGFTRTIHWNPVPGSIAYGLAASVAPGGLLPISTVEGPPPVVAPSVVVERPVVVETRTVMRETPARSLRQAPK